MGASRSIQFVPLQRTKVSYKGHLGVGVVISGTDVTITTIIFILE